MLDPQVTQPSLLARLRDMGDECAWRAFDEKYRDLILNYCRRRGLQRSDAEDVRQMVMLSLARQLRTFEYQPTKGRFRDYLGMTVVNAIHRHFRRVSWEAQALDTRGATEAASTASDPLDANWEEEWMLHHYRLALRRVRSSAEARSVDVFERLLAGESPDSVAASFQMSRDAVHKIKQRMRDRLRECIVQQIHEEELERPIPR